MLFSNLLNKLEDSTHSEEVHPSSTIKKDPLVISGAPSRHQETFSSHDKKAASLAFARRKNNVFEVVKQYIKENLVTPTQVEISEIMRKNYGIIIEPSTVHRYLHMLEEEGRIKITLRNNRRSIVVFAADGKCTSSIPNVLRKKTQCQKSDDFKELIFKVIEQFIMQHAKAPTRLEIMYILRDKHGIPILPSTIQRYINQLAEEKRLILTCQKSRNIVLSEQNKSEVKIEKEMHSLDTGKVTLPSIEELFPSKDILHLYPKHTSVELWANDPFVHVHKEILRKDLKIEGEQVLEAPSALRR